MKKWKKIISIALAFVCMMQTVSYANTSTALSMYQKVESAVFKKQKASTVQQYIDNYLLHMVGGGAEWYIILFYKIYGDTLDYKKYKASLDKYVASKKKISATTKQLIALAYLCIDKDIDTSLYLKNVCDETIGMQGIMSFIFGLHLLNNNLPSNNWTKDMVIKKIIDMYDENKGYSYMGNETDIDVTSMVVQALAPYYKVDDNVKIFIDKCIDIISKHQLDDATFINNGLATSESISQVILMASMLDIDIENDARLIKNNINLYQALEKYHTKDDLYSHIVNDDSNTLSTLQACIALGSMTLCKTKKDNLFNIRHK